MATTVPAAKPKKTTVAERRAEWRRKYEKVIKVHNDLIRARFSLTVIQQRILLALYSLVEIGDGQRQYTMSVAALAKLVGVQNDDYYNDVRDALSELKKHVLRIKTVRGELIAGWFDTAEYIANKGIVEFEISEKLKPFISELKLSGGNYTSLSLHEMLQLKSGYSIRLYQLLRSHMYQGRWSVSLDDFMDQVGIRERDEKGHVKQTLKTFSNIHARAIQPAVAEINGKSEIMKTEYSFQKTGRAVTGLNFSITRKQLKDPWSNIPEAIVKAVPKNERSGKNGKTIALALLEVIDTKVANGILNIKNVENMCRYTASRTPKSYVRYLLSYLHDPSPPDYCKDYTGDGKPATATRKENYLIGRTVLIDGKEYVVGPDGSIKDVTINIPRDMLRLLLKSGEAEDVTPRGGFDDDVEVSTA